MKDYLFESSIIGGTYSCLNLSAESSEELYAFCAKLGISNLVNPNEYHCTLIYSRKSCPDIANEDFGLPCKALPIGFRILGTEEKVLVLEIYCPDATRLHELFMDKHGATHDYPKYIPHITIAGEFNGNLPADIPEFEIEFVGYKVEELN